MRRGAQRQSRFCGGKAALAEMRNGTATTLRTDHFDRIIVPEANCKTTGRQITLIFVQSRRLIFGAVVSLLAALSGSAEAAGVPSSCLRAVIILSIIA